MAKLSYPKVSMALKNNQYQTNSYLEQSNVGIPFVNSLMIKVFKFQTQIQTVEQLIWPFF